MTYNFDPERWFDNEMAALEAKRALGKLGEDEFENAKAELVNKYEEMLERLDIQYDYSLKS